MDAMLSSYQQAKETLIRILNNHSYKVVALSGKWGTGKTHLWNLIKQELKSPTPSVPQPIFVSIFGAKTSNDLKLRLLQSGSVTNDSRYKDFVSAGGSLIKGIAGKFIPGLAVDELILLSLPKLLGGRLVVIDDVERKHKSLDIDEILGFINEYSENHKTRFLLLLNTDKLEDENIWKKLHEKVVDIELLLQPTSPEAFAVASADYNLSFLESARDAISTLGITNIRVIKRIIRVLSELLENYGILDEHVQSKVVPSTVLLTAIHYRGITSEITSEYVLQHNSIVKIMSRAQRTDVDIKWDDIINSLGISSCDDFENVVQDYLQTGIIDKEKLDKVMSKYRTNLARNQVQNEVRGFFESYFWDPLFDQEKALEFTKSFVPNAGLLSGVEASGVANILSELGETSASEQLIEVWIEKNEPAIESGEPEHFPSRGQLLHPAIEALNARIRDRQYPPLALEEAFDRIRSNKGWGDRENICFQQSTPAQYEEVIRRLRGNKLGDFLHENFSLLRTTGLSEEFLHGTNNFKSSCRSIIQSTSNSRLVQILTRALDDNNILLEIDE